MLHPAGEQHLIPNPTLKTTIETALNLVNTTRVILTNTRKTLAQKTQLLSAIKDSARNKLELHPVTTSSHSTRSSANN